MMVILPTEEQCKKAEEMEKSGKYTEHEINAFLFGTAEELREKKRKYRERFRGGIDHGER